MGTIFSYLPTFLNAQKILLNRKNRDICDQQKQTKLNLTNFGSVMIESGIELLLFIRDVESLGLNGNR